MNTSQQPHSRDFRCGGDCSPSGRNGPRRSHRKRRNHGNTCLLLFASTAVFRNECDAFVEHPYRIRYQTSLTQNSSNNYNYNNIHRKQSPFTIPKVTRKKHSRDGCTPPKLKATNTNDGIDGDKQGGNTANKMGQINTDSNGRTATHDVYKDLEKLERAIAMENADLKLRQLQLKETIDFVDQSKRLVVPDALRFLLVPLFYSWGLYKLLSRQHGMLRVVARSFVKMADFHFWIAVVGAPLLLNACNVVARKLTPGVKGDPIPDELNKLDPICATMMLSPDLYDYEDPRASCDDTVSFLAEYWASAVNGLTLLYAGRAIATKLFPSAGVFRSSSSLMLLWLSSAQVLTRLAAVVSLYQYPKKMYELERSEFTKPVGLFPTIMLKLVQWMMVFAPLGLVSDFSRVLMYLPRDWIKPFYASIAVALLGTWTRMNESVSSSKDPLAPAKLKPPKPLARLFYGVSFLALWRKQLPLLGFLNSKVDLASTKLFTSFPTLFWKTVVIGSLVALSILGPLIHLWAFRKIFQVEYTNDLPSLSTKESYEKAVTKNPSRAYDMAWRYSLRWRKPQRLTVSKGWLYHDALYLYLFKGSVVERIDNDRTEQIRKIVWSGRTIEDRIKAELEMRNRISPKSSSENTTQLLNGDRDHWKSRAMEFQARKHEQSYVSKRFEDPLGVAVYRAFGVGLGYNFDHMSELPPNDGGKGPSPRRLQARAAKSALRRYNELNDAEQKLTLEVAKLEEEDGSEEQQAHKQKLLDQFKKEFDQEIKHLSRRLVELVPTTSTAEEFGLMDAAKFQMKSEPKYHKISPNEYRKLEDDPLGMSDDESDGVDDELSSLRGKALDGQDDRQFSDSNDDGTEKDSSGGSNNDGTNNDNDDFDGLVDIKYV